MFKKYIQKKIYIYIWGGADLQIIEENKYNMNYESFQKIQVS